MISQHDTDPAVVYDRQRGRLVGLLRDLPPDRLEVTVAATPAWRVRDVLAHVVAITADLNAGWFGDGDPEAWTAAQVADRVGRSVAELAAEWDREAPRFCEGLRVFGYELGSHYVGDLVQHAADVRVALGVERDDDAEALAVACDFYLDSFHEELVANDIGAVGVTILDGGEELTLGSGTVVASVAAHRYELFRGLGGRRTLDQLRALRWTGDRDAVVATMSRYPVPATPVEQPVA